MITLTNGFIGSPARPRRGRNRDPFAAPVCGLCGYMLTARRNAVPSPAFTIR
jgi:hypothetical protein